MKLRIRSRRRRLRASVGGVRLQRMAGPRAGAATVDYFLLLAVIVPLVMFGLFAVPRIIRLVYDMIITMVGMPFM